MTASLPDHVAAEVRAELARQRLTQGGLARALGRSEPYVTRRLRGEVAFDMAELEAVAQVLKVPVSRFLPAEEVA